MRPTLFCFIVVTMMVSGCISPSWKGDMPGSFDDEGNYIPEDPTVSTTYTMPDISAGFLFDIPTTKIIPGIEVEVIEVHNLSIFSPIKVDIGVAENMSFGNLSRRWTSIFEVSTGVFGGWNWEKGQAAYGVTFFIISF